MENGFSKGERPDLPDPQECAILLLLLIRAKEKDSQRPLSRIRLAEITLKRLWRRHRLREELLGSIEEWMIRAGWSLFYTGTTFAMVKNQSVEGWPRLSSKRLSAELKLVERGEFNFSEHFHLLLEEESDSGDED